MAAPAQTQVQTDVELEDQEGEVEKLEAEVNEMAQKILQYRTSLPDQLTSSLASILAAQRPPLIGTLSDFSSDSRAGPSGGASPDTSAGRPPAEPGNRALLATQTEGNEKTVLLKQKILDNASRMSIALKRMKDCLARIPQLESSQVIIHPAFKRNRTS